MLATKMRSRRAVTALLVLGAALLDDNFAAAYSRVGFYPTTLARPAAHTGVSRFAPPPLLQTGGNSRHVLFPETPSRSHHSFGSRRGLRLSATSTPSFSDASLSSLSSSSSSSLSPPPFPTISSFSSTFPPYLYYQYTRPIPFILQVAITASFYFFHMVYLSRVSIPLLPSRSLSLAPPILSLGLDSLFGLLSLYLLSVIYKHKRSPSIPPSSLHPHALPLSLPYLSLPSNHSSSSLTFLLLLFAFGFSSTFTSIFDSLVTLLSFLGLPLTEAAARSAVLLLSHLSWVFVGGCILKRCLGPAFLSGRDGGWFTSTILSQTLSSSSSSSSSSGRSNDRKDAALPTRNFCFPVLLGYGASHWVFILADSCTYFLSDVLRSLFTASSISSFALHSSLDASSAILTQVLDPSSRRDFTSRLLAYVGPCVSAPVWEELLYRGFALPYAAYLLSPSRPPPSSNEGRSPAPLLPFPTIPVLLSALIFSSHHLSYEAFLPLAALGAMWATVYVEEGDLAITVMIHALWNNRVFVASWMGL